MRGDLSYRGTVGHRTQGEGDSSRGANGQEPQLGSSRTGEQASSLRITTWDKYQHYTDRRPPWIKLHVALLDDYELMKLSPVSKWLACSLLLVATTNENVIPNDTKWIAKKVSLTSLQVAKGCKELVNAGFLEPFDAEPRKRPVITPLPLARSQETETETENLLAPAAPKPKTQRARDHIFEAMLEACGIDYATLTESGRGPINRGVRELKAVDATPEEIHQRAGVYRRRYPEITLTPSALVKHWGALNDSNGKPSAEARLARLGEMQRRAAGQQ